MVDNIKMKKNGFFGIGCIGMKTAHNYGTLFRTAQVFGADFLFLIGHRFKKQASDTMKSWHHIPVYSYIDFEDFNDHRPHSCVLIGIELDKRATPISDVTHPKNCCYLLGAEDHGIPPRVIEKCDRLIQLPGERSLNVSVAGSIVLFDRINKQEKQL